jgi:hypothetical protein
MFFEAKELPKSARAQCVFYPKLLPPVFSFFVNRTLGYSPTIRKKPTRFGVTKRLNNEANISFELDSMSYLLNIYKRESK